MTSSSHSRHRHTVHRPRPSENGVSAAGGTGKPFPPRSVSLSQESPIIVSLTIPLSIRGKLGASPDILPCGFGRSDLTSVPPPKLRVVCDDDLDAFLLRPTRENDDPCHQTTRSSNFGTR
jgi:hypothetical protein